jgi:ribose 5-phosphate isomerase B
MQNFSTSLPVAIGSDHAGFDYKEQIKNFLSNHNVSFHDFGTLINESVDYPDYAHPVATAVENKEAAFGILICGSANGVAITANKHQDIRAALCWKTEIAALARQHNNANVICLPARFISIEEAIEMVDIFMKTSFEGGRHENRVNKIACH